MPDFDWREGTFITDNSGIVSGMIGDYVMYDVARDVGTIGARFFLLSDKPFTNFHSWYTGEGAGAVQRLIGESTESFGRRSTERFLGKGKGGWIRRKAGEIFEKGFLGGGTEKYWDVFPDASKKIAKGGGKYGAARVGSRVGSSLWNPLNLVRGRTSAFIKEAGWARTGLAMGSRAVGGVMHMQMSRGAVGFNLGYNLTRSFTNMMIAKGEQDVGNMTRVDMAPAFYDTREAATMRQAAVQQIQNTQLNLRSAFGQEAATFHR